MSDAISKAIEQLRAEREQKMIEVARIEAAISALTDLDLTEINEQARSEVDRLAEKGREIKREIAEKRERAAQSVPEPGEWEPAPELDPEPTSNGGYDSGPGGADLRDRILSILDEKKQRPVHLAHDLNVDQAVIEAALSDLYDQGEVNRGQRNWWERIG